MLKARELVKRLENELGQEPEDGIYNIAVSHDATWQKRGFTSLYGAVFVISELTGQVLDYEFTSKTCPSCRLWMYQDHSSPAYEKFIEQHKADCLSNYSGSSPAMEPHGAIILWKRSLDYNLHYVTFIGDGDSKSYQNVCQEKPYGSEYLVEKSDCIGHVQKQMGTALRKIKKRL